MFNQWDISGFFWNKNLSYYSLCDKIFRALSDIWGFQILQVLINTYLTRRPI